MSYPINPSTVVLKNKYYPSGLTERMIYDYYIHNKKQIISETQGRPILFFLSPTLNEFVIKRKFNNGWIYLSDKNYDKLITGRTVSISVAELSTCKYFCIDIDPGPTVAEYDLKEAVQTIIENKLLLSYSTGYRIMSTAKGYHIYFYLKHPLNINVAYQVLKKILAAEFNNKYMLENKPPYGNIIKLDTSPTRPGGSHTVPGALCRNGLICMDVTDRLNSFNRQQAIVK